MGSLGTLASWHDSNHSERCICAVRIAPGMSGDVAFWNGSNFAFVVSSRLGRLLPKLRLGETHVPIICSCKLCEFSYKQLWLRNGCTHHWL